jgi:hypothetical protein
MKTSKLWLRNTSRYPDKEVWPLIKCAYESVERSISPGKTMPRIIVKLTNCRYAYRGRASWREWHRPDCNSACQKLHGRFEYCHGEQMQEWTRVLVRIGPATKFPVNVRYPRFKGDMPEYVCANPREGIVMVAAHEIEHCLGASGRKAGEFRCELSAWDAIDYYRKHQAEVDEEIDRAMVSKAKAEFEKATRAAARKDPQAVTGRKLEAARMMAAKWARKQKLATGKLRKYQRAVKRLEKKISEQSGPAPLALAATTTEAK